MLAEAQEGIVAYDCQDQCEALVLIDVLDLLGDNPMQSEVTGHMGTGSTNHNCRDCDVGGPKAYKRSNEGYESLYNVRFHLRG